MPADTTCATCDFSCLGKASISSRASPPLRKFLNTGPNTCDWRIAVRNRRCFSMITAIEKKDSATRHNITAPTNRPTFPSSSLNVMISSCENSSLAFNDVFGRTDGGSSSVERTGNRDKSTRVLIPDQPRCCYLCATAHLPRREKKQPSGAERLKVQCSVMARGLTQNKLASSVETATGRPCRST